MKTAAVVVSALVLGTAQAFTTGTLPESRTSQVVAYGYVPSGFTPEQYKKFKEEVLPHRLQFLAEYSDDDMKRWDRNRRKTVVRMLDKSRRIYEIENKQRMKGQRVMTEFFRTSFQE